MAGAILGLIAALGVGGALGFGPLVRRSVAKEAAKRGLSVEVADVRPGWFSVSLRDVRVGVDGVPGVQVEVPTILVELSSSLSPRVITLKGGRVNLRGSPERLREDLARWRDAHARHAGSNGDAGARLVLRGEGMALSLADADDTGEPTAAVTGLGWTRDEGGTTVTLTDARVVYAGVTLEFGDGNVAWDASSSLKTVHLATASVALELKGLGPGTDSAPAFAEPPPLPTPAFDRKKGRLLPALPVAEPSAPLLRLPELHLLRAEGSRLATELASKLPEGASFEVGGLSLGIQKGGEKVSLGPGPLTVRREAHRVGVDFSTSASANGTPLTLHADLPTDAEDVTVSLAGGPVSLSLLGVKEGAAGLTDVDRASVSGKGRVTLAGAGDSLTFDVSLNVRGMAIRQPRLAAEALRGLDFGVSARGLLTDHGELRLDEAEGALGALRVQSHGALEQAPDHVSASLDFEVSPTTCQALLQSIPTALLPTVGAAMMTGTIGGRGHLSFDSRHLDDLALHYDIEDRCRMTAVPDELAKERFTKEFTHRVYRKDGQIGEEETGPGTDNWTDLDHISPYMQVAVLTTEDGAFYRHHGFNHAAIRGALIANLKARRFVRGASTITMQLAKNLFLTRDKTLGRKLEELILTDYLEQVFTKEEMMELYLNIIEFGPDIYGVTAAAQHYFGRKPEELNLAESLFLSSIMPSPLRYHSLWEKGALPESWIRGIHDRMEIASRIGTISSAELAEGLLEPIVFWHPDMPAPAPRQPLPAERHVEGGATWEETN